MEHDTPPNIRDNNSQDPEPIDERIRIADDLNSSRDTVTAEDGPVQSRASSLHGTTAENGRNILSPVEEPLPRRPGKKQTALFALPPQSTSAPVPTVDSRGYAPSQPFEEAGPTSSIWRAYLDESLIYDTDMLGNQRGQVNILLVFAGLFSAIVSAFIAQSAGNLQPDYEKAMALLLFDQINIQLTLASGVSPDHITTSGADPTAHFSPDPLDSWVNGLWFSSLTLSLATALFAVLADGWYCHYLSPVAGNPQVRARTRHLWYTGLLDWRVSTLIGFLPLMLHLSLFLFFVGLVLSLLPQQPEIALVIGIISMSTFIVYLVTNVLPIIFPECPYKTPLSSVTYAIIMWILRRFTTILRAITPLTFEFHPETKTLQGLGIYAAQRSRIKHEVDALLWLYVRSSTAAIRRLVIHALAGLPPEYIQYAEEAFTSHWVEIRDEKERMLMDCMELTRDGSTRWIPKDIPNIDRRIEPLLRLERLFHPSSRKFPFGLFGEHDLDFSRKDISDTLSTTLSSIDDLHIRMPIGLDSQKKVAMNALADNHIHHPDVEKPLQSCV